MFSFGDWAVITLEGGRGGGKHTQGLGRVTASHKAVLHGCIFGLAKINQPTDHKCLQQTSQSTY